MSAVDEVRVGSLYTIKLPANEMATLRKLGYAADSGTLLKRVVAGYGDEIKVTANGIAVNTKLFANSRAVTKVKGVLLNPLPIGYQHKLALDEYFMLGETANSFDSRYFGVVKRKVIINQAQLILKE